MAQYSYRNHLVKFHVSPGRDSDKGKWCYTMSIGWTENNRGYTEEPLPNPKYYDSKAEATRQAKAFAKAYIDERL